MGKQSTQSSIYTFFSPKAAVSNDAVPVADNGGRGEDTKKEAVRVATAPASFRGRKKDQSDAPGKAPLAVTKSKELTSDKKIAAPEKGRRLRVWWPREKKWYYGVAGETREKQKKQGLALLCHISYDDGDQEWLDVSKMKFEYEGEETGDPSSGKDVVVSLEESDEEQQEKTPKPNKKVGKVMGGRGTKRAAAKKATIILSESEYDEDDDDSDDESVVESEDESVEEEEEDEDIVDVESEEDEPPPAKKKRAPATKVPAGHAAKKLKGQSGTPLAPIFGAGKKSSQIKSSPPDTCANMSPTGSPNEDRFATRYDDRQFKFMWPTERRDGNKNRPGDEGFDENTIFIPDSFLNSQTAAQRQWWKFKSEGWTSVMLFKVGKFYEMFEMDAFVGVEHLGLMMMNGADKPHAGFPEKTYSVYAQRLVRKGYRVEVVEQTETKEQFNERNAQRKKRGQKQDQVVLREKIAVLTRGTLVDQDMLGDTPHSSNLLVLWEEIAADSDIALIGACVIDAASRRIDVGAIRETELTRPELRALISKVQPVEVLSYSQKSGCLSPATEECLRSCLKYDVLRSRNGNTITNPDDILYLCEQQNDGEKRQSWIDMMRAFKKEDGLRSLARSSLCFAVSYLQGCLVDEQVFSNANVVPLHGAWGKCVGGMLADIDSIGDDDEGKYMELDAAAIMGMELLEGAEGDARGSLLSVIDKTTTGFGKRLMRRWVCCPLSSPSGILKRQQAVNALKQCTRTYDLAGYFRKLPDLERVLAALQSINGGRNADRVVLYEDGSKKRLGLFLGALKGLQTIVRRVVEFRGEFVANEEAFEKCGSLLQGLLDSDFWGKVDERIATFETSFDWGKAESEGRIIPQESGVDQAFDEAEERISAAHQNLADYLKQLQAKFGSRELKYVSINKDSHLVQVPDALLGKVPRDFEKAGKIKGLTRFTSAELKSMTEEFEAAEVARATALEGVLRSMIFRFLEHQDLWTECVRCTAQLDVLISFVVAIDAMECMGPVCTPKIIDGNGLSSSIRATELRHPCMARKFMDSGVTDFVPNDINIGGDSEPLLLLTGPNMGGKSTLLRMVTLASVLAHLGMDVPAKDMEFTTCDRIFVRMGAQDNILAAQSTFLVELSETAAVLQCATRRSLVVLDELGRGTSTSDGVAIAHAVLQYLVRNAKCLTLFSTHYHGLVKEASHDGVQLRHMQINGGDDGEEDDTNITFLYKLVAGHCPKSYGMNVARLAGIPPEVVASASIHSRTFEEKGRAKEDAIATSSDVLKVLGLRNCQWNDLTEVRKLQKIVQGR